MRHKAKKCGSLLSKHHCLNSSLLSPYACVSTKCQLETRCVFATRLISKYQLGCKLWISKLINLEVICKGNFLLNTCVTNYAWQNIASLQMERSGSLVSPWRKQRKTFDRLTHTSNCLQIRLPFHFNLKEHQNIRDVDGQAFQKAQQQFS